MAPILVLGTRNRKKLVELEALLSPHGFVLQTLHEHPQALEIVEDGETFADNARKKASQQAQHLRRWVLGEDSGLVVAALGGRPGVYSARFSGESATDALNNRKLLAELGDIPLERRGAHYVCHLALANPRGEVVADHEEYCRGRVRFEEAGAGGFGYDPLFEIPEYHATFAQLSPAVKGALSHRGRAIRAIVPALLKLRAVWNET